MAGKRPLKIVRAVGRLIVCSHADCGDPTPTTREAKRWQRS